ncbi:MAG: 1-deoxy-D-xylulose-5-phosphate reductoisomerase [Candidatus Micrarchaeaceae archaeon]
MVEEIGISIHGSTGSIGRQTLDVIERLKAKLNFKVVALSCGGNIDLLEGQILKHKPEYAAVADEGKAAELKARLRGRSKTKILGGIESAAAVCGYEEVDLAVIGTAGFAGLAPTLEAIYKGKRIATANKETFLAAGKLVIEAANAKGVEILPMDSEPSAMWQCLEPEIRPGNGEYHSVIWELRHGAKHSIDHFLLTGSGGPFLRNRRAMETATPEQALRHPTWNMGGLITIRSATMMNKGMERIEASAIFGVPLDMVKIVIHPQSIVHSGIVLLDGTQKVQQGPHDMRYPIQYALTFPERIDTGLPRLDLTSGQRFEFEEPDFGQFPALAVAERAGKLGGTAPAVLNAADEVAVSSFLSGKIKFMEMVEVTATVLDQHKPIKEPTLEQIYAADRWARECAAAVIKELKRKGRQRVRI